jgi:hypothetical protein
MDLVSIVQALGNLRCLGSVWSNRAGRCLRARFFRREQGALPAALSEPLAEVRPPGKTDR